MHCTMRRISRGPWRSLQCAFGLSLSVAFTYPASAGEIVQAAYETGCQNVTEIGANLCGALDPQRRQQLRAQPVLLEQITAPCVVPGQTTESATEAQTVLFSAGFVQFLNQLSHAKAIEESEKGFVKRFAIALARESGERPLPPLSTPTGQNAWNADTLNYQVGNFNQMAGAFIAIEMAHHYLGHFKKYSAQLTSAAAQPVPINSVITEKEWREAVMKGAKNALDCGYGLEGLRCVFECFANMPRRPPWAAYFIHAKADVSKINRDLARLEKDHFVMDR